MANAAPHGNPTTAATAVAEKLTVRESATMCGSSAVPKAAETSITGTIQIPRRGTPAASMIMPVRSLRQDH